MEPLVPVEDFAGYLQRDLDRYSATLAVKGASGIVRHYCGWDITRTVEDMTVDGNGCMSLNLPTLRVNDITTIAVDGTDIPPDEYSWGVNGILFRRATWPLGPRRIVVAIDHGYDPVPDEVHIVCCAIGARIYSNPEGHTAKSSGDDSRTFGDMLSELEMRLISGYRLH